ERTVPVSTAGSHGAVPGEDLAQSDCRARKPVTEPLPQDEDVWQLADAIEIQAPAAAPGRDQGLVEDDREALRARECEQPFAKRGADRMRAAGHLDRLPPPPPPPR